LLKVICRSEASPLEIALAIYIQVMVGGRGGCLKVNLLPFRFP